MDQMLQDLIGQNQVDPSVQAQRDNMAAKVKAAETVVGDQPVTQDQWSGMLADPMLKDLEVGKSAPKKMEPISPKYQGSFIDNLSAQKPNSGSLLNKVATNTTDVLQGIGSGFVKGVAGTGSLLSKMANIHMPNAGTGPMQLPGNVPEPRQNVPDIGGMINQGYGNLGMRAPTSTAGQIGSIGGQILSTAAPGEKLYQLGRATGIPFAGSALAGAGTSAIINPNAGPSDLGKGAAYGVGADLATRGLSRIVQPIMQTPAVKSLLSRGIVPTPGAAAGGLAKDIEDKISSVPAVGKFVEGAQNRSIADFNRAQIQAAMPPGETAKEVGTEGLAIARQKLGEAYDNVYKTGQVGIDKQFLQDLFAAKNSTTIPLSGSASTKFDKVVSNEVLTKFHGNSQLPMVDAKKVIEARLGKAASQAMKSDADLGEALFNARDSFRNLMARHLPAEDAAKLPVLNQAYSNLIDMEKAAKLAPAQAGIFTPNQLLRRAKPSSPMLPLTREAQSVLPSRVPDSGTAGRYLMAAQLLGLGGAATNEATGGPRYLTALGLAPLLYSRPGSRYLLGDLPGQAALADAIRASAPYGATAGGVLAQP